MYQQSQPNTKKRFDYKSVVAVLCVLCTLLLMSDIGLIVYVLKNKNGDLNINDAYTTYATIHDAIEEQDLAFDDLVILAQVYKDQGLLADFEMQDDHIIMEAADGVTFIFTAEDMQTQTDSNLIFAVVNPAEESGQKEDLSFFDKLTQGRFIRLDGHIIFTLRFGPILRTNLRVADKSNWKQYAKAIRNREMIAGRDYFYICPSFFRNHLQVNALRGSVLFLRNDLCVRDNRLLNALFDKGLGMVVVMDQAMEEEQQNELSDLFMQQLAVQDADGSYRSAQACATAVWEQFCQTHPELSDRENAIQMYFPEEENAFKLAEETELQLDESEKTTDTEAVNTVVTIDPFFNADLVISLYLLNYSEWKADAKNLSDNYYYYSFLDLDFDGVLELVTTVNTGSDLYSHNNYYRIDPYTRTIRTIGNREVKHDGGGMDLKGSTSLYKNNQSGKITYYSDDTIRGDGTYYGPLWYEDQTVYSELPLVKRSESAASAVNQGGFTYIYYLNDEKLTEAEYQQLVEDFKRENTNLNLQWSTIDGKEFDNADDSEQRKLLLDAYNSFTFDGYLQMNTSASDFNTATEKDFYDLSYFCHEINEDYDCTSDDAFEFAIDYLLGGIQMYNILNLSSDEDGSRAYIDENNRDPLNYFAPGWPVYYEYDGERLDAVLRTVFNVEPQHDYIAESGDEYKSIYYHNGHYYRNGSEGYGESADGKLLVESAEKDENGIYSIVMREAVDNIDGDRRKLKIKAEIKSVNGKRVWSIYSVDYSDFSDFAAYQTTQTLTDEIAQELWFTANDIYCSWAYWREINGYVDEDNPIYKPEEKNWAYYPLTDPDIKSIADLQLLLANYFDETIVEDILDGFIEQDGIVYASNLAIGSDFGQALSVTVKSQTGNSSIIEIFGYDEMTQNNYTLEQTLEYIDGKWIFTDLFHYNY